MDSNLIEYNQRRWKSYPLANRQSAQIPSPLWICGYEKRLEVPPDQTSRFSSFCAEPNYARRVPAAAFFDLDRTLLPGASGPALSAAMREVGILPEGGVPGESLLFGIFDLIGETRPSMMLARQGVRFSKGWNAADVARAGELAASRLVAKVQPYARQEMSMHKEAGRRIIIATTSPDDMVRPLAAALGFDDVIATHYARTEGVFIGDVDGHYVWGKGKLAAVQEWASTNDCDLSESWAYSDSYYDLPMLNGVGHPVAVNPDPRLAVAAAAKRWPIRFFDAPEGVVKVAGIEPQRALMPFVRPEMAPYARFDIDGLDNIPSEGPVIVASNHRSYFDIFALGLALARAGRVGRFLGKRELFSAPVVGQIASALGGIPVDRGTGSDEPLKAAVAALEAGELIVILPEGTIPRGPAFFDPILRGRTGVARLAEMTGTPVVPISLWGTEKVWPRSARLPNMVNILRPPKVRVRVGEALTLPKGIDPIDGTELVMSSIFDLMPAEGKVAREPSVEELARTYPPGHSAEDGDDG